jgi:pilus assembly protein Flp/PilA
MNPSPVAVVVARVVRLVSGTGQLWLGLVVSSGVFAVRVYITCHNFIGSGYAKSLSAGSDRGVTAIEYGLIASLIALTIIVAVKLVGTNLTGLFTYIGGKVVAP